MVLLLGGARGGFKELRDFIFIKPKIPKLYKAFRKTAFFFVSIFEDTPWDPSVNVRSTSRVTLFSYLKNNTYITIGKLHYVNNKK